MINIHDWMHETNASVIFPMDTNIYIFLNCKQTQNCHWTLLVPLYDSENLRSQRLKRDKLSCFFVLCAFVFAYMCMCELVCVCVHVLCYVCVCVCECCVMLHVCELHTHKHVCICTCMSVCMWTWWSKQCFILDHHRKWTGTVFILYTGRQKLGRGQTGAPHSETFSSLWAFQKLSNTRFMQMRGQSWFPAAQVGCTCDPQSPLIELAGELRKTARVWMCSVTSVLLISLVLTTTHTHVHTHTPHVMQVTQLTCFV